MCVEGGGRRGRGPTQRNGGNEARLLQLVCDVHVEFCEGYRGEAETGFGGILKVRADVGKVDERHRRC